MNRPITRIDIINNLRDRFQNDPVVYAFWLEGSDALGTGDEFSDIDLWFDVEDGYEDQVTLEIKKSLSSLGSFDFIYDKKHGHPKIKQLFLHLEGTSEFLIIDLCIQSHSRKLPFIVENKDEEVRVIFDQANVITYQHLNQQAFREQQEERITELATTFDFFLIWVNKEIRRGNYLEAFNYYQMYVLNPLVELCRIKYEPTKQEYRLKHIRRDLPALVCRKIEDLYKVTSLEEIAEKTLQAKAFFHEQLEELAQRNN